MVGVVVVVLSIVTMHLSHPSLILSLFFSSKPSQGPWWQGLEVQQKRTLLRGRRRAPRQVRMGPPAGLLPAPQWGPLLRGHGFLERGG